MKKTTILLSLLAVAGCNTMGKVEKVALAERALADARKAPKEEHLAYLNCYPLDRGDKDNCRRKIKMDSLTRTAITWDYIRPYRYVSEKLGFVQFLHNNKRTCSGLDNGPLFNEEKKAYEVICKDGNNYLMRFDYGKQTWALVK